MGPEVDGENRILVRKKCQEEEGLEKYEKEVFSEDRDVEDEDTKNEARKAWKIGFQLKLDCSEEQKTIEQLRREIRGIRGKGKMGCMKEFIRNFCLWFFGMVETKSSIISVSCVNKMWGQGDFGWDKIDVTGSAGCILCVWDTEAFAESDRLKVSRCICVCGKLKQLGMDLAIMVVYGDHSVVGRRNLWKELVDVKNSCGMPCIVIRDFNEVLNTEEWNSGRGSAVGMSEFKQWIQDMNLVDLPLNGRKSTWRRGSQASHLDRICVDPSWIQNFSKSTIEAIKCSRSDHVPLCLKVDYTDWRPKPFKPLDIWFSHPSFMPMIEKE
ncbi:uncharacterized protein LOC107475654 [Arachis duranensis]|uniref:Uncharacterized protein LOC107475654 n=1 Tax=Arachis duranensis TaxID=130453 RepID=A0A6P4CFU2_ARADU|nr:uncharacterized protein LOC107475654 [Arachis duranensis]